MRFSAIFSLLFAFGSFLKADDESHFQEKILPVMDRLCLECHEPGLDKNDVPFLEAEKVAQIREMRSLWRSVGSQLRNRTMPPADAEQPTAEERASVATWIRDYLNRTAPLEGPYAGNVTARRLNRLEYNNTIRDLIGVDLKFDESLPADGGTGEGFDNSGEALFLQPMLMERYLEAAQQIVDAAIVSPRRHQTIRARDFENGDTALVSTFLDDEYDIVLRIDPPEADSKPSVELNIDGIRAHLYQFSPSDNGKEETFRAKLSRGVHALTLLPKNSAAIREIQIRQKEPAPAKVKQLTHQKLTGLLPGENPETPDEHVQTQLAKLMKSAFRRPVTSGEVERFMSLYKRGAERGDPWEESFKLALRGVLVAPVFLFRIEKEPAGEALQKITDHELASRLSYFLWNTMPDAELTGLADTGKLGKTEVLLQQTERLLNDERALGFVRNFIGQWLGTKDVGGRVAPTTNELQEFYKPEIASDMRDEVVLLFHYILTEDRNLYEFIDSDYTFLTGRLAKFYGLNKLAETLPKDRFQKVSLTQQQRGGVLSTGAVLAITSHYKLTSPVLRGAWVFDTLIGEPVPPPPPNVPELPKNKKVNGRTLTEREKLSAHRDKAECMSCHQIIDPIGFALQNYDYLGIWRDKEYGIPVDSVGKFPDGQAFNGPRELKKTLVETRSEEILRNTIKKMLSYAIGRSIEDRDDFTIAELTERLRSNDFKGGELIKGIVLSKPFQYRQK